MTTPLDPARRRLESALLYLVTPVRPAAGPLDDFLPRVLQAGVDVVQIRDKQMESGTLLRAAEIFRRRTLEAGALFVVNDRVDVAIAAGADGVHVGQDDLPPEECRRRAGPRMLIGLSTHRPEEIAAAEGSEADYVGVGPVHATPTKPGRPAVGPALVAFAARHLSPPRRPLPFFPIGGIDAATLPAVLEAGATRACVLRALADAPDLAEAVRRAAELRRMLEAARPPAAGAGDRP